MPRICPQLKLEASLNGRTMEITLFSLQHPLYTISAEGPLSMDGETKLKAELRLTSAFSAELMQRNDKLRPLFAEDGSLAIPVVITRKDKRLLVLPDFSVITSRAAKNTLKDKAEKTLDKVVPGVGSALRSLFK